VTFMRNIIVSCNGRNPSLKEGTRGVILNNYILNTIAVISIKKPPGPTLSVVGNVVDEDYATTTLAGTTSDARIYLDDNICNSGNDGWSCMKLHKDGATEAEIREDTPPVSLTGYSILDSQDVVDHVMDNVGFRPARRDQIDERILGKINDGTSRVVNCVERDNTNSYCDSDIEVAGGWIYTPDLTIATRELILPDDPHGEGLDFCVVDGEMESSVENNADGYTNLEEWLHAWSADVEGKGCDEPEEEPPVDPPIDPPIDPPVCTEIDDVIELVNKWLDNEEGITITDVVEIIKEWKSPCE